MAADMHWQVQQVKQRLSEVLRAAETDGPQFVTRHGKDVAVVMSIEEYDKVVGRRHATLYEAMTNMPTVAHDATGEREEIGVRRAGPTRASAQTDWA